MSNFSSFRLDREFHNMKKNPKSNYFQVYDLHEENLFSWVVYIIGPPNTLYAGGVFRAIIRFPDAYPMEPPSVQFTSRMYHPNVYGDGKVCISTLQTPPPNLSAAQADEYWRPVLGVEQALLSVVSLLSDANCNDPANQSAAAEWMRNDESLKAKCAKCAKLSREQLPSDFLMPVVVMSSTNQKDSESDRRSSSCSSSSVTQKVLTDGQTTDKEGDEHEDELEYVYSEDEDDNESFVFGDSPVNDFKTSAQGQETEKQKNDQATGCNRSRSAKACVYWVCDK
uniref:UBC core domain-containing protein n=1 Tax=Mucochytrium quahogii TaxID=96639 RepID=A0A7S2SDG6_9STRA|mmetsp:Transcript_94/g.135  ORF Transcript_94/g.135 Transcript_94/m.135 type:complete len:282 (+) Transcript_94:294-1139(+)